MNDNDLELLIEATELVVMTQFGSTSMLQQKLGITYADAGQIMDLMESYDVVGPAQESQPREARMSSVDLASTTDHLRREGGAS